MLEYGIRQIITNPTLITKADEIIKLIDSRSHQTRAFVLPPTYASLVEKLAREIEYRNWAREMKNKLHNSKRDNLDDIMEIGRESMQEYLDA
jgi:hypothetical protein